MKFQHTTIFNVRGILIPQGEGDKELVADTHRNVRVILTNSPNDMCLESDRDRAIANIILRRIFTDSADVLDPSRPDETNSSIATAIERVREERKKDFPDGSSLVVTISREVPDFPLGEQTIEFPKFIVSICDSPKETIRQESERLVLAALTAVSLASVNPVAVKKVLSTITFLTIEHKLLHTYWPDVSGRAYVSTEITPEIAESTGSWYSNLASMPELDRVYRLLASSMQSEGDILRSFLAAWTALEIFVSKVFAEYESRIFQELNEGDYPDVRRQYLQRIQEVMKDKYTLANRFSVVSCQLCPSDADTDIKIFTTAKNMRDKLSHGQDVLEAALPVAEVQNLARKYLRLHLQSITKQ